jgi:hypothetical protein
MKSAAFVKITNGQARAYDSNGLEIGRVGRKEETRGASMSPNGDIAVNQLNGSVRVYDGQKLTEKFRIFR